LQLSDVIDGFSSKPTATPSIDERAKRLAVCVAILEGAEKALLRLSGRRCQRSHENILRLDRSISRTFIEPEEAPLLAPVLDGESDWPGGRDYVGNFALDGHALKSVAFCEIPVERESLLDGLKRRERILTDEDIAAC
jgi:hypothetical protein